MGLFFFRVGIFFVSSILILISVTSSYASMVLSDSPPEGSRVFGPVTFVREKGSPRVERISFSIPEVNVPFLLRLTNGTLENQQRVSSALVSLNGWEVFRPSQFNQGVATLSRQVPLKEGENLLEVKLESAPGSSVTIEIFRLSSQFCSVFGPYRFIRNKGKPIEESMEFTLPSQFRGPYLMNVTNGDSEGSRRVDSAIIKVNETPIFDQNDFNEQVESLSEEISLFSQNRLEVKLAGAPGDLLTIQIWGYDHIPPLVRIISPNDGENFDIRSIPIKGIVDDPSASVTINGVRVPVGPDGTFMLDGVVLSEGANLIKVVATDGCGNQGEDQIWVYFSSGSQGPYLLLCAEPFLEQSRTPPEEGCSQQAFATYTGLVLGLVDENASLLTLQDIPMEDGVEINEQGAIFWGKREGPFFWAFVFIPQTDGVHPFTAVVTNSEGKQTKATVYFLRDTTPPGLIVTSPLDGMITNTPNITISGTVDDPEAVVRIGWYGSLIPVVDGSFVTMYTLQREGANDLTITARDPFNNYTYVSRRVILDTGHPLIAITSPISNAILSGTITIGVESSDETSGVATVSLWVDGQLQATLDQPPFNFPLNTLLYDSGTHTLTARAIDNSGNWAEASIVVLFDHGPPEVSITSPVSGVTISGTIMVSVEARDSLSGLAGVALYLDNQPHSTLTQGPFNFTINTSGLVPGLHTLTVKATDRVGNQGEASITINVEKLLQIEITSPTDGATINQATTVVQGRIYDQTGEIGVTVNGVLAEVQGNEFAVMIPLQIGQNLLTAIGTRPDGIQAQAQITIHTEIQEDFMRLNASPTNGILDQTGKIDVHLEAEGSLSNPVSTYSWDFDGDGTFERVGSEAKITVQYLIPGIYLPKVRVVDDQGNVYEKSTVVNVFSKEEMDGLLRSKWEGMKGNLLERDLSSALGYFVDSSKGMYQRAFEVILDRIPQIVSEMGEMEPIFIRNNIAKYRIERIHSLDGGIQMITYYIYFVRDRDGLWRIDRF